MDVILCRVCNQRVTNLCPPEEQRFFRKFRRADNFPLENLGIWKQRAESKREERDFNLDNPGPKALSIGSPNGILVS